MPPSSSAIERVYQGVSQAAREVGSQMQARPLPFAGLAAAVALSVVVPGQISRTVAVAGGLMAMGYTLGAEAEQKRRDETWAITLNQTIEDLQANHELEQQEAIEQEAASRAQAEQYRTHLESAKNELEEAIGKLKELREEHSQTREQSALLQGKLTALQEQFEQMVNSAAVLRVQQLQAELQAAQQATHEHYLQRIKKAAAKHKWNERCLISEFEKKQEKFTAAEAHYQEICEQMQERYESLLREYQAVLDSYHPEIREVQALFAQQMESVNSERDRVYAQLSVHLAPKKLSGSAPAVHNANRLLDLFLAQGIICELEDAETRLADGYDLVWFKSQTHAIEAFEKYTSLIESKFHLVDSPDFFLEPGTGLIRVTLYTVTADAKDKSKTRRSIEDELVTLDDTRSGSTGYMIVGNSGSAKSSVGLYLMGVLTEQQPAQCLILDPHGKANGRKLWSRFNLPVILDVQKILQQLVLLEAELNRRLDSDEEEFSPLVVLMDETNSLYERLEARQIEIIKTMIKRLSKEGRKYRITFVVVAHSDNCNTIEIDSKERANYIQIVLGRLVSMLYQGWGGEKNPRRRWVEKQAYPCIILEGGDRSLAKHPTHSDYLIVQDNNEPKNLKPVNQLPLTIELAPGCDNLRELSQPSGSTTLPIEPPEAGDAPSEVIASPSDVEKLQAAWQLSADDRTPLEAQIFDPLAPGIPPALVERVLAVYASEKTQNKTILVVFQTSKSGTSLKYRCAKWKFRHILHEAGVILPGKIWQADPDDLKSFDELITGGK